MGLMIMTSANPVENNHGAGRVVWLLAANSPQTVQQFKQPKRYFFDICDPDQVIRIDSILGISITIRRFAERCAVDLVRKEA